MISCDVLIVGGGTGGTAAALAACSLGLRVVLTEETHWVGGQLTSQAVPPDEHPWIEQFGCTRSYREYRNRVRHWYKSKLPLTPNALRDPLLNPGGGWVSKLCHDPRVGHAVLQDMLQPYMISGSLILLSHHLPVSTHVEGDFVRSVVVRDEIDGITTEIQARFVLDATESGDLLPLTGTEYVVGSEASDEPHASGSYRPDNCQALTWVFAMAHDEGSHRVIDRPANYDRWKALRPPFWPGPLIGEKDLDPVTLRTRKLPFWGNDGFNFFTYRQILDPSICTIADHPVTIVNWPMNDYFEATVVDVSTEERKLRLGEAKELSLALLYWLQTDMNMPGLHLAPDFVGTDDGFAMAPYIRESRRIVARFTVKEQHVSAQLHPSRDRAAEFVDSMGVGAYRIDLHPSTGGDNYIDLSSLPFQIPLGSLVPIRMRNLLPACKNLGVTHITNGCYRLHPVEWNIGEAAGYLAAWCVLNQCEPAEVYENQGHTKEFQQLLVRQGIELEWPRLRAL